jgi:hypothetical protein
MGSSPSWDAVIILIYIIGMGYNIILHRDRVAGHIAAAYIALAVTTVISSPIHEFLIGNKLFLNQIWIKSNASPQMVSGLIFLGLTVLLASFLSVIPTGRKSDNLGFFELFLYSFLWVTFVISTILSFIPEDKRVVYVTQSNLMHLVWQYHVWWLVLPAFLLIWSGFRRGSTT